MDIAEQIRKHLPRNPIETVPLIDEYCQSYQSLFSDVRNYEYFKYLHLGLISDIKRKSLPQISKVIDVSAQNIHHFLTSSNWSRLELENNRLQSIFNVFGNLSIIVAVDETGDRKKGNQTDYVSRQYLGSVGKVDRGIVSVNTYGIYQNISFPLITRIFKPQKTLKDSDIFKTKIELAIEMINYLVSFGFKITVVLADSLYGESGDFIKALIKQKLNYIVSIRKDHGVWMPSEQKVRSNKWYEFKRVFSNGNKEDRYIREIIYGKRHKTTYWQITTNTETLPENGTSFVKTNLQDSRINLKKIIGNLYGQRTWIEYGFRQCKQELGWTDYRLTKAENILNWWEIINSVYWMISMNTNAIIMLTEKYKENGEDKRVNIKINHPDWRDENSWKNTLINYRIMIQPIIIFCTVLPWLNLSKNNLLWNGFNDLLGCANYYMNHFLSG